MNGVSVWLALHWYCHCRFICPSFSVCGGWDGVRQMGGQWLKKWSCLIKRARVAFRSWHFNWCVAKVNKNHDSEKNDRNLQMHQCQVLLLSLHVWLLWKRQSIATAEQHQAFSCKWLSAFLFFFFFFKIRDRDRGLWKCRLSRTGPEILKSVA